MGVCQETDVEEQGVCIHKRMVSAQFQFNLLANGDGAHFPLPHTSWTVGDEVQLIYLYCLWRHMPANAMQELLSFCL